MMRVCSHIRIPREREAGKRVIQFYGYQFFSCLSLRWTRAYITSSPALKEPWETSFRSLSLSLLQPAYSSAAWGCMHPAGCHRSRPLSLCLLRSLWVWKVLWTRERLSSKSLPGFWCRWRIWRASSTLSLSRYPFFSGPTDREKRR